MRPGTQKFYSKPCATSGPLQVAVVRPGGLPRFRGWNRLPRDWRLNPLEAARNAVLSRGGRNKHERNAGGLASAAPKCAAVLPVIRRSAPAANPGAIAQIVSEE